MWSSRRLCFRQWYFGVIFDAIDAISQQSTHQVTSNNCYCYVYSYKYVSPTRSISKRRKFLLFRFDRRCRKTINSEKSKFLIVCSKNESYRVNNYFRMNKFAMLVVVFVAFLVEKSMFVAYCDDAMRFVVVTIVFLNRLIICSAFTNGACVKWYTFIT